MYHEKYQHLRLGPLRALKSCDLLNLGKINVLCGKNNTGKSTLLEAASYRGTASFGLTPDDAFIERLVKANRQAVEEQSYRTSMNYSLPYGLFDMIPQVFQEVAQSRPAWFINEEAQLAEQVNKLAL